VKPVKDPYANQACSSCRGYGEVVAERWCGFPVRVVCDCVRGPYRLVRVKNLLRREAEERAE